jgi:hypothetical protein
MTISTNTALAHLADRLRRTTSPARVVTSGPDYEAGRTVWNGAVTHRPAVILRCADAADVQAGVRAARELDVSLSVRGGGHDWAGRALTDGGLTLDVSAMCSVAVDAAEAVADVGGGATAADLMKAAQPFGLAAAIGTVGDVGMVGLSLGGGYGPYSGRFGLALDNIVSVDVVLADGSLVTADSHHEPQLFWALGGGGGNFGVVTAMQLRLHPAPSILGGMIMFPWAQAARVLGSLGKTLLRGPDELTVQTGIVTGPSAEPVVFVAPTWCGAADAGERAIERIAGLGEPLMSQIGPLTAADLLAQTDGMFPVGRHIEIRPRTVPALTPAVVEALVAGGETMTSPQSAISLHSLHGAPTRVPVEDTAFGIRTPHLVVETIAIWEGDDAAGPQHRAWARNVSSALASEALPGGYVNLLGPDEASQIGAAYGPNTRRLLAVKQAYDAENVFAATPLPPPPED